MSFPYHQIIRHIRQVEKDAFAKALEALKASKSHE